MGVTASVSASPVETVLQTDMETEPSCQHPGQSASLPSRDREQHQRSETQVSASCQAGRSGEPQSKGGPRRCNFCHIPHMISSNPSSEPKRALWSRVDTR